MPSQRPTLLTAAFARILAMQTLFGASQACYVLLPKFLATELDALPEQIGGIAAVYSLANVLLIPVVGMGTDRYGRRVFLIFGNGLSLVASVGFIWIDAIGAPIYALRTLQGAGFACVFIGANTLVVDHAPPHRLSHALALLTATMHGTSAAVPLVVEPVAERLGWLPVFVAAAVCAGLAWLLAFSVHNRPAEGDAPARAQAGMLRMMSRPVAWRMLFVVSMVGITAAALFTFIQPFAVERGIPRIAPFLVTYSAVAMVVRIFLGGWLDRVDRHHTTAATVAGYAVLLLLIAQVQPAWLLPLGALFGIVHGAFFPAFNAMSVQRMGEGERGKAVALVNGAFNVGFTAGNLLLGHAAAAWGYPTVFVISSACMAAALGLLLSVRGAQRWTLAYESQQASGRLG